MKLYYFYTLETLWNGQGKIKMYYWISRLKKQLLRKRSIEDFKKYIKKKKPRTCNCKLCL